MTERFLEEDLDEEPISDADEDGMRAQLARQRYVDQDEEVWAVGARVWGLGFVIQGSMFWDSGFPIQDLGFHASASAAPLTAVGPG